MSSGCTKVQLFSLSKLIRYQHEFFPKVFIYKFALIVRIAIYCEP